VRVNFMKEGENGSVSRIPPYSAKKGIPITTPLLSRYESKERKKTDYDVSLGLKKNPVRWGGQVRVQSASQQSPE